MGNVPASDPIARLPIRPYEPVRRHRGWEVSGARGTGVLDLVDLTPFAKMLIRATPGSAFSRLLACPLGRTRHDGDGTLVLHSGPDEWLLVAPAGTRPSIVEQLDAVGAGHGAGDEGELTSVLDVTHGGFLVRLTGADSNRVLEKLCAIDLSGRATPNGSVFRSSVARVVCEVARDDVEGVRSYLVHGDRSVGQYLFNAMLDAGSEFSIGVAG